MIDKNKVLASDRLPSLPAAALKVLNLTRGHETNTRELVATLRGDPALTARILRVVNSPLFGLRRECSAVEQAVVLLGVATIGSLALGFSLFPEALPGGELAAHYQRFWRNCITQATGADALAKLSKQGDPSTYFAAAMLQDVGMLALLNVAAAEYAQVLDEVQLSERSLIDIEKDRLGFTHVDISVGLLVKWNLPEDLRSAIAGHHELPIAKQKRNDASAFHMRVALATASLMAECVSRDEKSTNLELLRTACAEHYDLREEGLTKFLDDSIAGAQRTGEMMAVNLGECPSCEEIMAAANVQLAARAIQAELGRAAAEQQKEDFRAKALRDALTGLYNRHYFAEQLEREFRGCARADDTLGLIFVDLDHFKVLNDTYGHQAGDAALKAAGNALQSAAKECDIVARYGGEEFVILIVRPDESAFRETVKQATEAIAAAAVHHGGHTIAITASVGAVIAWPSRCKGRPEDLIERADAAMYESKQNGRNQFRIVTMT